MLTLLCEKEWVTGREGALSGEQNICYADVPISIDGKHISLCQCKPFPKVLLNMHDVCFRIVLGYPGMPKGEDKTLTATFDGKACAGNMC